MLSPTQYRSSRYSRSKKYINVGDYQYCSKDVLGQGFSSKVYKGAHKDTKSTHQMISEQVAIKVINPQILNEPINATLLESELKILEKMKGCENILEVYSILRQGKNTFIVSQVCQTDVSKILEPILSFEVVEKYVYQLLQGFKQIFRKQIIHRDLKPANLFIDSSGNLKIGDFGFALKMAEARQQTKFSIGSPMYMAPEALKNNEYSYKSDIWAIGIVIYEILTGDTPWKAESEQELYQKLQEVSIQDILVNDHFPEHINEILRKTLQFNKDSRISPQQLILFSAKNKSISKQTAINKIAETKTSKNLLYVPTRAKNTKTEKFFKPTEKDGQIFSKPIQKNIDKIVELFTKSPKKDEKLAKRPSISKNIQDETYLNIPEEIKPTKCSLAKTKGSNTLTTNQQIELPKITRQQSKGITQKLIYYIHTCRLMYKIINRFDECIENGFNAKSVLCMQNMRNSFLKEYCKVIVEYIYKVKNLANNNFLGLTKQHLSDYVMSNEYKKLRKACADYVDRYSKSDELRLVWVQSESPDFDEAIKMTVDVIQLLWKQVCQKNHNEIILLEFMVFGREVLGAMQKGSFDYVGNKSQIQKYVDTIPNPPNFNRFKQAVVKAKKIIHSAKDSSV